MENCELMRSILLYIFSAVLCLFSSGQGTGLTDGPYVFYREGDLLIESVQHGQYKRDSLSKKSKDRAVLQVAVPGGSQTFSFSLKRKLENEASEFKGAEKMLVLSDIEGTFDGFRRLLLAGGVIDDQLRWIFGTGHLVICGDVFDRGEDVTACLWLLYKLEEEAKSKGGYVHLVLGNHEIMNLSGDTRYVHQKYFATAIALKRDYNELFADQTELGRWLRTKNIVEKVGPVLFLHGGVSQAVNGQDTEKKLSKLLVSCRASVGAAP